MRLILLLLSMLMLTACIPNTVRGRAPVFTAADENGSPTLRAGVWNATDDGGCRVQEGKPLEQWPECAYGFVVEPGRQLRLAPAPDGKGGVLYEWLGEPAVLASGDPRVMQTECGASARAMGYADQASDFDFCFEAVRPTHLAPDGAIVELVAWPIFCGPPPKDEKAKVTDAPFPGMKIEDDFCTAENPAAMRGAAAASEALPAAAGHRWRAHWVRDGYH